MNDIRRRDDFPPLTIDQTRDLAVAVREEFGSNLTRENFVERLLLLLEDVPGVESGEAPPSLIDSTWGEYVAQHSES